MQSAANIIPLVLLIVVFYLLIMRPARNRQKEFAAVQQALAPGAEVMLASGIHGTLTAVDDTNIQLEIAPGTVITVARQAVGRVLTPVDAPADESSDEA